MQSGIAKSDKWILEFKTKDPTKNPLMGWESSSDTLSELKLEFSSKELAINYAKKKKINYEIIEPGDHVICAVSNKKIMLENLNYWNVDLQEAYFSFIEAQLKRENLK